MFADTVLGQFVRHELISQSEAEEIFQEKEEKVSMLGMRWVSRNLRARTSYVMPKSHGVRYPKRCYEVQTTRVAWTADEINYGRKFCGRKDEGEGVQARGLAKEREEPSGKHEVVKRGDKEKRAASAAPVAGGGLRRRLYRRRSRREGSKSSWMMCRDGARGRNIS